ncbi:MAG: hypothetical protein JSV88_04205 [Candidatus Aminicenantes bacterium]|nr:MAG: hypothetical protein JSV88_04205 [Candidatus Aminicenantes bacterium]
MKQKQILTVMIFLITFALVGNNIYCALHGNDIIDGFPEPEANNIESLVIEGSSLFFQGMSDIMKLFDEGEKGSKDGNLPNSLNLIAAAVIKLNMSREKYLNAINEANSVDKSMCDFTYLEKFNYDQLAQEKGLITGIANEVKNYLSVGNVVGFYQKIADDMDGLIKMLEILKEKLSNKLSLYQEDYWLILQQGSRLMLLGNYGTVMGKTAYNINKG